MRLAFSHLPLHRLLKAQAPILQAAMSVAPAMPNGEDDDKSGSGDNDAPVTEKPAFREVYNKLQISVQEASAWLCSDGQNSFGAPDVLQVRPATNPHAAGRQVGHVCQLIEWPALTYRWR